MLITQIVLQAAPMSGNQIYLSIIMVCNGLKRYGVRYNNTMRVRYIQLS